MPQLQDRLSSGRLGRLIRSTIVATLAASAVAAAIVHGSPAADALSAQTYQLRNVGTGRCLAIPMATSNGPRNDAVLAACGSTIDRTFRLGDLNGLGRRSLNFATSVCLARPEATAAACTTRNDVTQTWTLPPVSTAGAVSIRSDNVNICLSIASYNSTDIGDRVCDQYPTTWVLEPVPAPRPVKISLLDSDLCAARASASPYALALVKCAGAGTSGLFYVINDSGLQAFVNTADHATCVRQGDYPTPNGVITAGQCQSGDVTHWWRPSGQTFITQSGLCMDTSMGRIEVGTKVVQQTCSGSPTQRFALSVS